MKLTVLVDNNTLIDKYYAGEPAVSYFIECDGRKYLFDAGYSDIFIKNAAAMGMDLLSVDAVIISHGHNDHTRGLQDLVGLRADLPQDPVKRPRLIAHPAAFEPKRENGVAIGSVLSSTVLADWFSLQLSREPVAVAPGLVFLGEIERQPELEALHPVGETMVDGRWQADEVLDDSALVYKGKEGLVIITGCSHAGICNIIEYAKRVCGDSRVAAVVGGFHLLAAPEERLARTAAYFKSLEPQVVYAAHCTDLAAKIRLAQVVRLHEVGVGLEIEYK